MALSYRICMKEIYQYHISKLIKKLKKCATSLIALKQDDGDLLTLNSSDESERKPSDV